MAKHILYSRLLYSLLILFASVSVITAKHSIGPTPSHLSSYPHGQNTNETSQIELLKTTNKSTPLLGRDLNILDMLMRNYDQRVRPPPLPGSNDSAVRISVNILVRMLSKIDVVNMEYSLQITFREQWLDRRLAYQQQIGGSDGREQQKVPKYLTVPFVKAKIWLPDTFFPTEKSAHRHMLDTENMFVRIHADGTVLYSSRLSLVCSCPMHLQLYPLDVQHCDFDLISYAHTTRDIVYEWASNEPVQLKPGVGQDLPNFQLDSKIDTGVECTSHTNTGSYACLRMRMHLRRLMTYFVLQLYFPTTMIVCVSLVSFWIDMHSTAGRVALATTTLLTITTMQSSINAKLPPVNYVKVVDVWLGACQAFVFSALIEYAIVCYRDSSLRIAHRQESELRMAQRRTGSIEHHSSPMDNAGKQRKLGWLYWALGMGDRREEVEEGGGGGGPPVPCTCELDGISSAVLASLGILPADFASPFISSSLLWPISGTAGLRRSFRNTGNGHSMNTNQMLGLRDEQVAHGRKLGLPALCCSWIRSKLRKPEYLPARIDYYARIWMPMGFLLFNLCYWTVCLGMASQQQIQHMT